VNNRRKLIIALGAGALVAPFTSLAQQQGKVWRIGFLSSLSRQTLHETGRYDAFLQGMRELGHVEGKDFVVEWRFGDEKYEQLSGLAADLVQMKVDIIVAAASPAIRAAQQATPTIPIVMANTGDPVGSGFVGSLAHPGGNITGLSNAMIDYSGKHVELLMTIVPKLSRVAILGNPGSSTHPANLKNIQTAARQVKLVAVQVDARTAEEIERAFAMMVRERVGALIIVNETLFIQQRRKIAELAVRHRLPSISANRELAEADCLMSYGQSLSDNYRRAATYVDKILKGTKPAELPVEQPMRFELVINRRTFRALGLLIPQELLLRADKVIE
jgi:ABC-type uncharacterized transport system substrate-binding protein